MTPHAGKNHASTGSCLPPRGMGLETTPRGVVTLRVWAETQGNTRQEVRGYVQGFEGSRCQGSDTDPGSTDRPLLFSEHDYRLVVARRSAVRRLRLHRCGLAQVQYRRLDGWLRP